MRIAALTLAGVLVSTALPLGATAPSLYEHNLAHLRAVTGGPDDALLPVAADASARGLDLAALDGAPATLAAPQGMQMGMLVHYCASDWTNPTCGSVVGNVQTPVPCNNYVPTLPGVPVAPQGPGAIVVTLPPYTLQTPTMAALGLGPPAVAHNGGKAYGSLCILAQFTSLQYMVGNGVFVPN